MSSTGDRLRAERERRQLTISQAAEATNIKADHIRALESNEWDVFSAPVYVRGFVRTYARFLRLDDKTVVAQLDEELAGRGSYHEEYKAGGLRRGPLDYLMMKLALLRWQVLFPLLLGIALIGGGYWAWQNWRMNPSATQTVVTPRLYTPATNSQSNVLPLPPITNTPPTTAPSNRRR